MACLIFILKSYRNSSVVWLHNYQGDKKGMGRANEFIA